MTPPPSGSKLIVAQPPPRLVVVLPAGAAKVRFLLVFGLLWNGLSWPLAASFFLTAAANGVRWALDPPPDGPGQPVPWWTLAFVSLFPLVGLAVAGAWLRLRFVRKLILAEPNRAAVRTEWFGLSRTRTFVLSPGDRAALEVAYEENDVPRHRVRVGPKTAGVGFGAGLTDEEVRWLCEAVNVALDVPNPGDLGADDPAARPSHDAGGAAGDRLAPVPHRGAGPPRPAGTVPAAVAGAGRGEEAPRRVPRPVRGRVVGVRGRADDPRGDRGHARPAGPGRGSACSASRSACRSSSPGWRWCRR